MQVYTFILNQQKSTITRNPFEIERSGKKTRSKQENIDWEEVVWQPAAAKEAVCWIPNPKTEKWNERKDTHTHSTLTQAEWYDRC